jgi:YebC/PmpR family DNA-binding regulatory protein
MSGHSKWANIKRQKQAADLKRGNIFSKLSKAITLAVMGGQGSDPQHNVKLRLAIEKAKAANMPKENINRAIERGAQPAAGQLKEVIFEAFTPEGVALMILAATDNVNRTLAQVRNVLQHYGGKLAKGDSVSYQFRRCGLITLDRRQVNEEAVFSFAQNLAAFDIDSDENAFYVWCPFENLGKIKEVPGLKYQSAEIDFKPNSPLPIAKKETAQRIFSLIDSLEDLEDVQKVFANFDIPEEYLK